MNPTSPAHLARELIRLSRGESDGAYEDHCRVHGPTIAQALLDTEVKLAIRQTMETQAPVMERLALAERDERIKELEADATRFEDKYTRAASEITELEAKLQDCVRVLKEIATNVDDIQSSETARELLDAIGEGKADE